MFYYLWVDGEPTSSFRASLIESNVTKKIACEYLFSSNIKMRSRKKIERKDLELSIMMFVGIDLVHTTRSVIYLVINFDHSIKAKCKIQI